MKPAPFEYRRPATLDAALALLAELGDEAKILAGGQSLIPTMNFRLAQPAVLIDINRLPDLDAIAAPDDDAGSLRIGALARHSAVERSPVVAEHAPLVHETMPHVAHIQIRNRGTVGGSLAHADPAAELPAVTLALDARFRARSQGGERWIAAADFFTGLLATALADDELLLEVAIPPLAPRTGTAFVEFARRHGDYALAGAAAVVTLDAAGNCEHARIVLMSVADRPVDSRSAADSLAGHPLTDDALDHAAHAAAAALDPHSDVHATADYRRHLAGVLTRKALHQAVARARAARS